MRLAQICSFYDNLLLCHSINDLFNCNRSFSLIYKCNLYFCWQFVTGQSDCPTNIDLGIMIGVGKWNCFCQWRDSRWGWLTEWVNNRLIVGIGALSGHSLAFHEDCRVSFWSSWLVIGILLCQSLIFVGIYPQVYWFSWNKLEIATFIRMNLQYLVPYTNL